MSREVVGVPEFGQSGLAEELFDDIEVWSEQYGRHLHQHLHRSG